MSEFRIVEKPKEAWFGRHKVKIMGKRCPTQYEHGAFYDVEFVDGSLRQNVSARELQFETGS